MILGLVNTIPSDSVRQGLGGGGGGGGFTNTYSLAFDGVDDVLETPVLAPIETQLWTLSTWVKWNNLTGSNEAIFSTRQNGLASSTGFDLYITDSGGNLRARTYKGNGIGAQVIISTSTYGITTGVWYNIVCIYNSGTLSVSINDGAVFSGSASGNYTASGVNPTIGKWRNGSSYHDGNIDEVAIWGTDETANISTISTSPVVDLTSLSPIVWLRNGDNGSYKSPQWLIPENSNKDKVSNYSFEFDGVDDYIDIGNPASLQITGNMSISAWVKTSDTGAYEIIVGKDDVGSNRSYYLYKSSTQKAKFYIYTSGVGANVEGTSAISDGNWHHILAVNDGTDLKIYVDGALEGTNSGGGGAIDNTSVNIEIGRRAGVLGVRGNWTGSIDEVAIWNSDQSANVASIYNSGAPTTITGATAYWKMGEESNFTDNWLVNNSALSNYSTRSFNFDGVDDNVNLGDIPFVRAGGQHFSISTWVNTNSSAQGAYFGTRVAPSSTNTIYFYRNSGGGVVLQINNSSTGNIEARSSVTLSTNQWYHIAATFDGSEPVATDRIKIYINGVLSVGYQSGTGTNLPSGSTGIFNFIGALNVGLYQSGNIDEVAIWDSTLTSGNVTTIYNSGTPADLTSLSPVSWWRMGEDATFNTNWSLPDNGSASNTGTSANMTIADLEGEAPNYTGGGLSANMTIKDRVGDAPNSTSNAVSFNMDEADRETDVPT